MQSKLQELTEKIYQEGLEKGNEEANTIVKNAKVEAAALIEAANKEALSITSNATKKAEEIQVNTESEIKLSSKQALNALKQEITDVINDSVINSVTEKTFDSEFTKKIVDTTLKNWSKDQSSDLNVLLPASDEKELRSYFMGSIKDLLDGGLELSFDSSIKAGFKLAPKDGSYKMSFTDEDFTNFFKQYLRPKLIEILFK